MAEPISPITSAGPPVHVRWLTFGGVFAAAFAAYVERSSLSVVAAGMMPALGLTQVQLGLLFNAFLITYTVFQFPGGLFAQRYGARRTTFACLLLSTAGTAATAFAPVVAGGALLIVALLAARALTGVGQGPLFPANAGLVQAWFPAHRWALLNGLQVMGLGLGAAATPPLLAAVMLSQGWAAALYVSCIPALAIAALWWWGIRDTPAEYGARGAASRPTPRDASGAPASMLREAGRVLGNRNVLLISLSYLLMNYVFYFFMQWSFLYLIQERKLTLLQGGWLAAIPLFVAALAAAVGGVLCDAAVRRLGPRRGFRLLPIIALPLSAGFLLLAVRAPDATTAVAGLAACFGCVEMTEASFWAASFWVARDRASAATGVLNTGGNLGGIIGTPIIAALTGAHHWQAALGTGVACALVSAALWLFIDVERNPVALTRP